VTRFRDPSRLAKLAAVAAVFAVPQLTRVGAEPAAAASQTIVVELDRAKLVRLPEGSRTIVQGQPIVVRVTRLPAGSTAVLTGTAFGETNLLVLDAKGVVRMDAIVRVDPSSDAGIVVHRGLERTSYYDCERRCAPRMQLGDTGQEARDVAGQIQSREIGGNPEPSNPSTKANATPKRGGAL
jgi:hypothetical protein